MTAPRTTTASPASPEEYTVTITRETYVTTVDHEHTQKVTAPTTREEFDNIARFARIVREAERPSQFASVRVQVYCVTFVNDVPGRMYGITNYCVTVDPVSADIDRVDIVRRGDSTSDDDTVAVRRFDVITDTILSR